MKKLTSYHRRSVGARHVRWCALPACGGSNVNVDKGHVYFLSMKVEQQDQFKELAESSPRRPVSRSMITASSDTYEQFVKVNWPTEQAPTLFDVDNNDFLNWTDYYATCREPTSTRQIRRTSDHAPWLKDIGWCCALRHVKIHHL